MEFIRENAGYDYISGRGVVGMIEEHNDEVYVYVVSVMLEDGGGGLITPEELMFTTYDISEVPSIGSDIILRRMHIRGYKQTKKGVKVTVHYDPYD